MFPFARKQNMNLRPIEQIRFPRKGNTLFTKNLIFENYVEFCRQNNANSQAVCHIPYKISRTQHSRQRRCRARPSVPPQRRVQKPTAALRRRAQTGAGGVLCFLFYAFPTFPLSRHASLLCYLYSFARGCAPPHTAKQRPPHGASPVHHCKRVPGGRRGFCWLGSASVSGAPTTRRANAATAHANPLLTNRPDCCILIQANKHTGI